MPLYLGVVFHSNSNWNRVLNIVMASFLKLFVIYSE